MARSLVDLGGNGRADRPMTLASLGQHYKDMPTATFDDRFGPYNAGAPYSDRDLLRLYLQQLGPEEIMPGTRSWPAGFIQTQAAPFTQLAGDVVPLRPGQQQPVDPWLLKVLQDHADIVRRAQAAAQGTLRQNVIPITPSRER